MPGRVNGFSLAYTAAGAVVLWSGIRGWTISQTFRNLLGGKTPTANAEPITSSPAAASPGTAVTAGSGSVSSAVGSTGSAASEVAAKAVGSLLATSYGWGPGTQDWSYLESGWQEESGWNVTAANDPSDPYDHAYGIPQANPGTKMASAGADWKTSASTQIRWGLDYIKATYGRPTQVPGWSANGPLPGYVGY